MDYLIYAIKKDKNSIVKCKVVQEYSNKIKDSGNIYSKLFIIEDIEKIKSLEYYTSKWNDNKKEYEKLSKVSVINGKTCKYLRSDGNSIEEDNLGDLPTFE